MKRRRKRPRARRPDLWEAILAFRRSADLRELRIEDVYAGIRELSNGRVVST